MTIKVVYAEDSFRAYAIIREYPDIDGNQGDLVDPASHSIQLYEPDGDASGVEQTSPTKISTGKFYQALQIPVNPAHGNWKVRWIATFTDGGKRTDDGYIEVKP